MTTPVVRSSPAHLPKKRGAAAATRKSPAGNTEVRKKTPRRSLPIVLTIGHSNRSIADFLALLKTHDVQRLVDVRTVPRSRHNPQFNRLPAQAGGALPQTLRRARIAYTHLAKLGGLRRTRLDSPNTGWNNLSFRGFADYMQTAEFAAGIARLEKLARPGGQAKTKRCVIMCAEAVPWRCHRLLLADALTVRGYAVEHIITPTRRNLHKLTPFARVRDRRITYPATRATRAQALKKQSGKGAAK
ncbi:MAG TPA: DUF488 domain-containing protein [Candidatus Dormibacteraeota bacterium]|nr:DUF488 domain-containing protein [Candidatus Dormibacteraeota bacterium]